jgi:predicted metalloprotease
MSLSVLNKKARWLAALGLLSLGVAGLPSTSIAAAPGLPQSSVLSPQSSTLSQVRNYSSFGHFFFETFQASSGAFWYYWNDNGGLAQQGFPISEEFIEKSDTDGKEYLVQYYERAVFEYHPETTQRVLLSLLGNFEYKRKYPNGAPGQQPNTSAGSVLFRETGKRLGGPFLAYWRANGGLAQQGFPISDEFMEVSPVDGKQYRVQYFERAVFELHPETPRTPVLLSLLGRFQYERKYQANLPSKTNDLDGDTIVDTGDNPDICPRSAENMNNVFDTDGCPDTLQTLLTFAAEDLDNFWRDMFEEEVFEEQFFDTITYRGPVDFIPYFDESLETSCGPALLNNAFYCGRSHGIYYHWDLLESELTEGGDFAPVTIIAHEWGHLIQGNLGRLDGQFFTIDTELQADCYAGVWTASVEDKGLLDEGDIDEGANTLFNFGDDIDFPWFEPGAHGQPEERIAAFLGGYRQGVEKCEQYTR